jgi:hypothetical protein
LLALPVSPYVAGLIWGIVNVMIAVMNVVQMRYLMTSMPNDLLGRVQAFITLMSYAVLPVGALLTGGLLQTIGPPATVLCFGAVFVALAVYTSASRGLRA